MPYGLFQTEANQDDEDSNSFWGIDESCVEVSMTSVTSVTERQSEGNDLGACNGGEAGVDSKEEPDGRGHWDKLRWIPGAGGR
jgi:hypothetical protein